MDCRERSPQQNKNASAMSSEFSIFSGEDARAEAKVGMKRQSMSQPSTVSHNKACRFDSNHIAPTGSKGRRVFLTRMIQTTCHGKSLAFAGTKRDETRATKHKI
jgi:hypothetical protein